MMSMWPFLLLGVSQHHRPGNTTITLTNVQADLADAHGGEVVDGCA
jgi:hypothetical protein